MTFTKTAAQAKALQLLSGDARHVMLYGGSRSGKSAILVLAIVVRALMAPNTRHAIARLHFNHVKASIYQDTLPKILALKYPELPVVWNQQDLSVTFPNGSQILLIGLDDKERTERVLGQEFSTIFLNEISQIPYSSVQIALTRLAQKSELVNKVYYDCNPPQKSHWAYRLFVKKINPVDNTALANPGNYVYMQMNPEDNLVNISEDYIENTLKSLSHREQERFLYGNFRDDNPYALFKHETIDTNRIATALGQRFERVVVGVDPAVTSADSSDDTGIVVVGIRDGHYYVIADYTCNASPLIWAGEVVKAYHVHKADRIIGEVNNGGDLIETTLRTVDPSISFRKVTATRGKAVRAEPIAALYEQGKVHHLGAFQELEDQMCEWVPNDPKAPSPDRMDALVWAITELMSHGKINASIMSGERRW